MQQRQAARRSSAFDDPMVRTLSWVLVIIVLLFLTTIVAALMLGVIGSDKPRTSRERDLQTYEFQTSQGSTDAFVWKAYVGALVDSGQLQKAQQVIDRGLQVIDNKPGADLTFAQAQVYYSGKKYQDAVDAATGGMAALQAWHDTQKNIDGTPQQKGEPVSDNYWGMLYIRALSYRELGDNDKALADFDTYLDEKAGASDVYVMRGDIRLEMGDREGAEEDYRRALTHLPDYQPALDGLEELGVDQ